MQKVEDSGKDALFAYTDSSTMPDGILLLDNIMGKVEDRKPVKQIQTRGIKIDVNTLRRNRIESLKKMIHNEEYMNEAIVKLANSLTTGLMK